ncbi:group XIIA secretory phospholipase A2 isoform X1 [Homalodisca vitripennis]|uniref:group XIIA secretory phospholipase A2 isoform X1 n=1 Tax=Homalodisca vitripennis TaxID=197043 RepID=UPI001EEAD86A|nr:group XIIA secretory phospholipase A2 isoform X1 [Homalodisca vitripennis]
MLLKTEYYFILCTFLCCYCFTDAQVLEGLKDAVLTAEGTLGDIFKSLHSIANHFKFTKEVWEDSVEEECIFTCPGGTSPKKNKYHKPTSNGCGVPALKIDSQLLPMSDMTKCCDQHDICYGTCNRDKDECDLTFKKCLYRLCDNSKAFSSTKSLDAAMGQSQEECKTAAKVLYSGVLMFGCKFYKTSQEEACYCPPPRKFPGDEL